jgi:hypothetical protein
MDESCLLYAPYICIITPVVKSRNNCERAWFPEMMAKLNVIDDNELKALDKSWKKYRKASNLDGIPSKER